MIIDLFYLTHVANRQCGSMSVYSNADSKCVDVMNERASSGYSRRQ